MYQTILMTPPHTPSHPLRSAILLGSNGNGKSHLMLQLLRGPYRGLHSRVIVVSPNVHIDPLWQTWTDFSIQKKTLQIYTGLYLYDLK